MIHKVCHSHFVVVGFEGRAYLFLPLLLIPFNSICLFIINQWCVNCCNCWSNTVYRSDDAKLWNTSLILCVGLICSYRSVLSEVKCYLTFSIMTTKLPPPPYFSARFSCSCRPCSSRSYSVRIKGILLPPPTYAGYGRGNSVNAVNIACISASAFCSVDIT